MLRLSQCSIWGSDEVNIKVLTSLDHFLHSGYDKTDDVIQSNSVQVYSTVYRINEFIVQSTLNKPKK